MWKTDQDKTIGLLRILSLILWESRPIFFWNSAMDTAQDNVRLMLGFMLSILWTFILGSSLGFSVVFYEFSHYDTNFMRALVVFQFCLSTSRKVAAGEVFLVILIIKSSDRNVQSNFQHTFRFMNNENLWFFSLTNLYVYLFEHQT